MGCGKTTIGGQLAQKLTLPFIDTDQEIENKMRMAISEIFGLWGESKFREIEEEIVHESIQSPTSVIALGGGAVLSPINRELIRASGIGIYLQWTIDTLYRRLKHSDDRPLLRQVPSDDRLDLISQMFDKRRKYYEQADILISAEVYPEIDNLVDKIIDEINAKS